MEGNFALAFSNSSGVGPKSYQRLLKVFGSAENAWNSSSAEKFKEAGVGKVNFAKFEAFKTKFNIANYVEKLRKTKVEFIPYGDKYYPVGLTKIDSPPIGLYVKGDKELLLETQDIGVVGARKITSYGAQVTENLVSELCRAGFVIVSGMAAGVDAAAHKAAIESDGKTIAVLGCGVDCPYPKENERLYEEILDSNNLVISEYPLGMSANPGTFPARNRIVSALSLAVLITEAAEDSGSLITADHALTQGKTVFAVPGPITSQMSRGSLKLLKQGAVLVSSAEDILEKLKVKNQSASWRTKVKNATQNSKFLNLNKEEQKIIECLENEEMTIDEIARETKIPISKLSIFLSEMELKGMVASNSGKWGVKS